MGCPRLRCEEESSDRSGVLIVVYNDDGHHQVVIAPERTQIIEWFPKNAKNIEASLNWLLYNDLSLKSHKYNPVQITRLEWMGLASCMGEEYPDQQCDFSDNQYLLVAILVLVCVRIRCKDPQLMVRILQCELARCDANRYQLWRNQLMVWQRDLLRLQQNRQPRMEHLGLYNGDSNGVCASLLDTEENICPNHTLPRARCWCYKHTPPLLEYAPSTVVVHGLPSPVLVAGYFEDRWATRGGWDCSYAQFEKQVKAYKTQRRSARHLHHLQEDGYCVLRFVNVSVDEMENIIDHMVVRHLDDLSRMRYLMVDFLQGNKSFVRYHDLKQFEREEFTNDPEHRIFERMRNWREPEGSLDLTGKTYFPSCFRV